MIKSLSPYYVTTPFVSPLTSETCTSYTLQIFVWDGLKASVPASATYEKTIDNIAEDTGDSKVNISRLINDYIDFTPAEGTTTELLDGNNQLWLQHQVIYNTPTVDITPTNVVTDLFISGYGYGNEGENTSEPTNKVLMSGTDFNVFTDGYFIVPILINESTALQTATIISYPTNEINTTLTLPNTSDSSKLIQYLWVDATEATTDEYIEVVYNGVIITLYLENECRYTPINVAFQNKEGAMQFLSFFKARKDSLNVTKETFESDRGQPSNGNHQFIDYNVNGKSKFTINSGFVEESNNEAFKQLILSERVWIYELDKFKPINVSKKSLEYKTRQNDRLINYEFEFEYSYNEINNI